MALSQADRISISAKIVGIPAENAAADQSKSSVSDAIAVAQTKDNANANLQVGKTALINPYQTELQNIDGNGRTQTVEQDVLDAAQRKLGNFFFPNSTQVPLPHEPSGVWKFFNPYYFGYAVGKTFLEVYTTVPSEQAAITNALFQIAVFESEPGILRVTGESCTTATPPDTDDTIGPFPAIQSAMTNLITDVNTILTCTTNENSAISSNPDTNQQNITDMQANVTNIGTVTSAINTWLAVQTFNTSFTATTCAEFNGLDPSTLYPTKGDPNNLTALKNALNARSSYLTTRVTQLQTILGSVTQSTTDGTITASSGLYGDRAKIIGIRLNALGGSLGQLISLQNGSNALDALKSSNQDTADVYSSIMNAQPFASPANGTGYLNVMDGSGFAASDTVYVVTDTQPEIQAYVKSTNGNQILLDRAIPSTYLQSDKGRLYKVL
jgi:hypothetical protein